MAAINFGYHPQFFTATILAWKQPLKEDEYKDIITNSLLFLKNEGSIVIYAFVVPIAIGITNPIHLVWQIQDGFTQDKIQMRLLKFTAQQMKFRLLDTADKRLPDFFVNAKDRQYQFWERYALSVDLWTPAVIIQKINYLHHNPFQERWAWAKYPEGYKYSSARFYETGENLLDGLNNITGLQSFNLDNV